VTRTAGFAGFVLTLLVALTLQIIALPDSIAAGRPMWLALVVAYWSLKAPNLPVLVAAWLFGLCCDVLFNTVLGQHALALTALAFAVRRLRPVLVMFPLWQSTLALVPVWAAYAFLLFWIDGLTRHPADPTLRWLPVLATAVAWPFAAGLLGAMRSRRGSGGIILP
jgi:rod shape-determining protein MreD